MNTTDALPHHEIRELAQDVVDEAHELSPGDELLVVQVDALDQIGVSVPAGALDLKPVLDALKELELTGHRGLAQVDVVVVAV